MCRENQNHVVDIHHHLQLAGAHSLLGQWQCHKMHRQLQPHQAQMMQMPCSQRCSTTGGRLRRLTTCRCDPLAGRSCKACFAHPRSTKCGCVLQSGAVYIVERLPQQWSTRQLVFWILVVLVHATAAQRCTPCSALSNSKTVAVLPPSTHVQLLAEEEALPHTASRRRSLLLGCAMPVWGGAACS